MDDRDPLERALEARLARRDAPDRLTFEASSEVVIFALRHGRLVSLCTCGKERCEHRARGLSWLGSEALEPALEAEPKNRLSSRTPLPESDPTLLATAFDAVLLAVVRAGTGAASSPSVRDAIDQLITRCPKPTPAGVARWIGQLNDTLARNDPGQVARVLEGARRLAEDLRQKVQTADMLARKSAWLAGPAMPRVASTIEDCTLVEVARERVAGIVRNEIERRYLVHLTQGTILREERLRSETDISLGPCGRLVQVSFGEVEPFGEPKRIRLLQYVVAPLAGSEHWAKVGRIAQRLVSQVAALYARAVSHCPALIEPVILFAPRHVEGHARPELIDSAGERLALGEEQDDALAQAVHREAAEGKLVWVAGRLLGSAEGLILRPLSMLVRSGDRFELSRIT